MKKSYKLLSIFIDSTPVPIEKPEIAYIKNIDHILDENMSYGLLDYFGDYQRKISGTKLLSCEDEQSLINILDKLTECDYIWIYLDFYSNIEALNNLFIKRTLQFLYYIKCRYPDKNIGLASDKNIDIYDNYMNRYF